MADADPARKSTATGFSSSEMRKLEEKAKGVGAIFNSKSGKLMTNTKYGPVEIKKPGEKDDDDVEIDSDDE